eukprot:CAMPEP_0206506734 /NCGR_PEP_ID=MMETSP0324_2-20121206/56990_1 /ASSEMBLY_ACC=CAM_ASM_000836 /TAXON_ID=2866 /ORGANISM="Crypthecodinium cohnii, Strain Seligo" /LENGTH=84 /DNA_ID=CAMNT_0053996617 /DNA_START=126 /DNA_END=379 /DNA_ORIENTATION=+
MSSGDESILYCSEPGKCHEKWQTHDVSGDMEPKTVPTVDLTSFTSSEGKLVPPVVEDVVPLRYFPFKGALHVGDPEGSSGEPLG